MAKDASSSQQSSKQNIEETLTKYRENSTHALYKHLPVKLEVTLRIKYPVTENPTRNGHLNVRNWMRYGS